MRKLLPSMALLTSMLAVLPAGHAQEGEVAAHAQEGEAAAHAQEGEDGPSAAHLALMYVPNRVLDLADIVRLRIRLGPGVALGARATEYLDFNAAFYTSVWFGLPGPRGRKLPKLPFGIEMTAGIETSVVDATSSMWIFSPDYSDSEFGLSAHLLVVGIDFGIDPVEIVDFLVGLATYDLCDDDL